ncbi:MAG: hypothetical protein ACJ0OB_00265 [Flavobacteriaceae bacterium]
MKKIANIAYSLFISIILISCSSDGYEFREPVDPTAANLSKPANNTECLEVDAVKFEWNKSENTDSYTITVIDLISSESTIKNSNTNSIEISLVKGRPYSWQITSKNKSTSKTAKSEVWKFYLSGTANTNHAPFPAEIISPKNNTNVSAGSVELSWKVDDVDTADTHTFDVYLDQVDASTLISADQSATTKTVTVSAGTYYWSILSKDDKGNQSHSGKYKFTVQ